MNINEMLKYLCNSLKKKMLFAACGGNQGNQSDIVESSRKVGEAFLRMFEFSALNFKKKSTSMLFK